MKVLIIGSESEEVRGVIAVLSNLRDSNNLLLVVNDNEPIKITPHHYIAPIKCVPTIRKDNDSFLNKLDKRYRRKQKYSC